MAEIHVHEESFTVDESHRHSQNPIDNVHPSQHEKHVFISTLQSHSSLLKKVIAEVICTFIMVFTGCGSVLVNVINDGTIPNVGVAIIFGLVVMAMVYSVGHISGAHMNPTVTLSFAIFNNFPWIQVPMYIAAQCAGSTLASFMLHWILNPPTPGGAVTNPLGSEIQSFLLEIVITFVLLFVVGSTNDPQAHQQFGGFVVGSAVGLLAMMGGPISGASMNPARSLGPAIAFNDYKHIWIYMVAPFIGAFTGMAAYTCIRLPDKTI